MRGEYVGRVLKDPAIAVAFAKRFMILGGARLAGARRDRELVHLASAWSSGGLPRVDLRQVFPGIESCDSVVLRKPESRTVGWSLDLQELVHLLSIMRFTKAKRILEIGTFDGFSALNMAANIPDDGEVATLDLPPEQHQPGAKLTSNTCDLNILGSKFRGETEEKGIRQVFGNSAEADWSKFGSPFDLIFVDGCHDYRYVKSDSVNAIKHTRPGGTVLWHDYGQFVGVSRAVDELARTHKIVALTGTRLACCRV